MGERDELCGRTVGEFVLRERIGEGGFGAVYRCEQPLLGREAVVKVLHHRLRESEVVLQRFMREAQLASKLDHPYAAHVYAFGVEKEDGLFWIAMEMVQGTTLDRWLDKNGPLPIEQFVPFFERVAEVVQTAHERGIVHRDLKPSNIMVIERAGRLLPKLLDFGIAKLATSGVRTGPSPVPRASSVSGEAATALMRLPKQPLKPSEIQTLPPQDSGGAQVALNEPLTHDDATIGSPPYMSPEQWNDPANVGPRADLYALGIVAYEALTGWRPFTAETIAGYIDLHCHADVPAMGDRFAPKLDELFKRALAKKQEERPATALELAAALRVAAGLGVESRDLPHLDEGLRDSWLACAPQSLAEVISVLDGARNAYQGRDAARDVFRCLLRYLLALALAARTQVRDARTDPDLRELLRGLRRGELAEDQRVRLLRLLVRPFADRRGAYPIPELVDLVAPVNGESKTDTSDALDAFVALDKSSDSSAAEDIVRSQLAQLVQALAKLLRACEFVLDYPLVVPHDRAAECWTGLRRQRRAVETVRGTELVEGQPLLIDGNGEAVVAAWPLIQVMAPADGAERELFVFDGRGRHGARLVSTPSGFEHDDPDIWDWLGEHVIAERDVVSLGDERAPYLGLASFSEADADRFVGREREVEVFANRLRQRPLQVVVGASGAGKSSFVQAGVIPSLPAGWRAITLRPGASPFSAMAAQLAAAGVSTTDLRPVLESSPAAATALVAHAARDGALVIVIDQLEELFTLCREHEQRERFAALIAALAASPDTPIRVIGTVRDDFLMDVESLAPLRPLLSPALFLLGNPSRDDLVRTIVEPARRAGYELSDGELAQEMAAAVTDRPGALALLSFTASRLWELRDRRFRQLTRKAYEAMGGVGGALGRHAEETLSTLAPDEQRLARGVFSQLVTSDETRAVLTLRELKQRLASPRADAVLDKLIAARLLAVTEAERDPLIEITHEALIAAWPRLREWIRDDADLVRMREQLHAAASQWTARGRQRGLLWRDEALAELERWRRRSGVALTDTEAAFAEASHAAAARGRRIWRAAVATAFATLAIGLVVLLQLNRRAETARGRANEKANEAHQRLLDLRVEQGRQALLAKDPMRALAYLSNAYTAGARGTDLEFMIARSAAELDTQQHILAHDSVIHAVAFSPDSKLIATAARDGARVWEAATGRLVHKLDSAIWTATFSADGTKLATASDDKAAKLWDARTWEIARVFEHPAGVRAARLSPDGSWLATVCLDRVVRIWDVASGELRASLAGHTEYVKDVAIRSDGARLLTWSSDNTARLWKPGGEFVAVLAHAGWVRDASFGPDGRVIATASDDHTVKLWDSDTGRLLHTLEHFEVVDSVAFSPDGKRVATASDDDRATIWNVERATPEISLIGHTEPVLGAQFTPDGHRLLTFAVDGTARLWDTTNGAELLTYAGHSKIVLYGAIAPDGHRVITGSQDGTVRVWDAHATKMLGTVMGDPGELAVAGDDFQGMPAVVAPGDRLLVASERGTPTIRSLRDGKVLRRFDHPLPPGSGTHKRSRCELGTCALWSPDGEHVLALPAGDVQLVDDRAAIALPGTAHAMLAAFSDNGARVAIGFLDRPVQIWTIAPLARIATLEGGSEPWAMAFSPDASRIAITHGVGGAGLWDASSGRRITELRGHAGAATYVAWSRDGARFATAGGREGIARIWTRDGELLVPLQNNSGAVYSVTFDPTGDLAVTTADGNTAAVWSARLGTLLYRYRLQTPVGWAGFSSDGTRLLAIGVDVTPSRPPSYYAFGVGLERRTPDELVDFVRCRVPFAFQDERLVPAATSCK